MKKSYKRDKNAKAVFTTFTSFYWKNILEERSCLVTDLVSCFIVEHVIVYKKVGFKKA